MKALQLLVLCVPTIFMVTTISAQASDYTKLCRLFKNNTKIRVPGSCDQYFVCNGETGQIFSCEKSLKYNAKQEKCIAELNTAKLCDNYCSGAKDGTWVVDPTNCHSFYYCENGQALASSCQEQFYFDEAKQMCVYPSYTTCKDVNNICDLVPDKTLFFDDADCSKYYRCDGSKHTKLDCKTKYFNVQLGTCVEKKTVQCNAHPIAADICKKSGGMKPDGGSCRGYFLCADKGEHAYDLQPAWLQCPAGKFFSEAHQSCLPAIDVKCLYNRCDGRGSMSVQSSENNCRNYIVCENNVELKEVTCGRGYFFDELVQACVPHIVYYKCCDEANTHS